MLVACRLAGLSALEGHYGDLNALPQQPMRQGRPIASAIFEGNQAVRTGKAAAVPGSALTGP